MTRRLDWAAVDEWQRLMADWQAAQAELEAARNAASAAEDGPAKLRAAVTAAEERVSKLQTSIDALVKRGAIIRDKDSGTFVVATVGTGEDASDVPHVPDRKRSS